MSELSSAVALTGTTINRVRREFLGVFTRCSEDVNGRPSYRRRFGDNDVDIALRHVDGCWCVCVADDSSMSMKQSFLHAPSDALQPDKVQCQWKMKHVSDTKWVPTPGLSCICGETLNAALSAAPATIALTGATPQDPHKSARLGVFTRRTEDVNGLPSYVRGGDVNIMLWHCGRCWYVGIAKSVGLSTGFFACYDGSLRPDKVQCQWHVCKTQDTEHLDWVSVPGLSCISEDALAAVLAAAPATVVLTGSTFNSTLPECWGGCFARCSEDVNGWPSYVLRGDEHIKLRHDGCFWGVGTEMSGHYECFVKSPDSALHPDKVEMCWNTWDARDDKWVPMPGLSCIGGEVLATALSAAPAFVEFANATDCDSGSRRVSDVPRFARRSTDVNGYPSYVAEHGMRVRHRTVQQGDILWHETCGWVIGPYTSMVQKNYIVCARDHALHPDKVTAPWMVWNGKNHAWIRLTSRKFNAVAALPPVLPPLAAALQTVSSAPPLPSPQDDDDDDDDDVVVVGVRTREERDAEGRLNAIDLDAQPDCKRTKTENAAPSSVASLSTSATPSGT